LGTGNFGTGWGYGSEIGEVRGIYECYREAGGNLIDTANHYQFGQAEMMVGELLTGDRDNVVLATKYSLPAAPDDGLLLTGNSRKTMLASLEASLRRLATDRVDILWVHMPDGVTPIEEIVRGFEDLTRAGKIIYAGLSDFPAWRVATAATIADIRGNAPLSAIQIEYSLVERTPERELLPMAKAFGLTPVAWGALAGGLLTGKYRRGESGRVQALSAGSHKEDDPRKTTILDTVLSIAAELGKSPGNVATAWVIAKGVLPILGPRTGAQMKDHADVLNVKLSTDQMARLDTASGIAMGFPHDLIDTPAMRQLLTGGNADSVTWPLVPPK
jgi:aryl-alcohol dehydrogenase-like predicted oxidoreductase